MVVKHKFDPRKEAINFYYMLPQIKNQFFY